MNIIQTKNYKEMSEKAAEIIEEQIRKKPSSTICFATGKTMKGTYKKLVKAYKKKKISFSKIRTFNLDEYWPIKKSDKRSMKFYMHKRLFDKVNLNPKNINLLNPEAKNPKQEALEYEKKLKKSKVDLQILGLGVDGHIGYNEPGSEFNSKTRLITLNKTTIKSKKLKKNHPKKAITIGIKNILSAKKIILLASGKKKAKAIFELIERKHSKKWPVTALQKHKDVTIIIDKKAGKLIQEIGNMETAYKKAVETIEKCSTKNGLYASGGPKGYFGVWSRDSMITLIGASTDPNPIFKEQFQKSINTLKKHQAKSGQIPNAVMELQRKKPQVDFKSIDSSLWFVIGNYLYKQRYKDKKILKQNKKYLEKAIQWIKFRDFGENTTLEQLPTTDWQDAFPHKYGATINTQALYYGMLKLIRDKKLSKKLKKTVNENKDDKLWNGKFYWAYRWKNHNKYKEIGTWFDSLGNLLAIIFDLANKKEANLILNHIEKNKISEPYPTKCIAPPIKPKSEYWEDYYYDAKAIPNHYLNGGIWPFIGGFHVLVLIKRKKFKQAKEQLEKLAEANLKNQIFPEWIDPTNKKTYGIFQAWSAGTYIWAYNSLKAKRVL